MKKFVTLLFVITISTLCLLAFSACAPAGKTNDTPTENDTLQTIYGTYVAFAEGNGTDPLSYEEWLESVKGKDGADGASVTKAEINNDGYLVITLSNGNTLIAGKVKGEDGKDGTDGTNGTDGISVTDATIDENGDLIITLSSGQTVNAGKAKGEDGKDGADGSNGANGANGSDGENGVSVSTIELNEQGEFIITLSDGSVKTVKMPEHEHAYGDWVTEVLPECEAKGLKYRTCTVCGEKEYTFIDALGHTPDEGVVIHPATETASGVIIYTCQTCGKSYVELIPVIHVTEGLEYTLNEDGVSYSVTGIGTATDTDIIIPSTHNGKLVTKIDDRAFQQHRSLTSVTISKNIINIGSGALRWCHSLINITVDVNNKYYKSIDGNLYNKAGTKLIQYAIGKTNTSFTIPDGVTSIGDYAFSGCSSLTSVTIPDSVTSIDSGAFDGCSSLTSITIPDGVTSIGDYAFSGCSSLTSVTIPDSVTSIGRSAFVSCPCIKTIDGISYVDKWLIECHDRTVSSVIINEDTYGIADYAFENTFSGYNLTSVTIPDSVRYIGDYSFSSCNHLTSITIPDRVTSIGEWAFNNCSSLTSVTIPDSVMYIGDYAFYCCSSLTNIAIGNSVTSIGEWAFGLCYSLTSITVDVNNKYYKSIDGNLYNKAGTKLIQYAIGKTATSFTIPDSVTSIGDYAFSDCSSLTSITIPDSVRYIGEYAFDYCISLTSITVDVNNKYYKSIDGNLYNKAGTKLIQYAIGKTATSFTIPDSVTSIGDYAFSSCDNLTSVTIPDSVRYIGDYAFYCCSMLEEIELPVEITSIGEGAFNGCGALTSITIESYLTSIGVWAFDGCSSLTSVYYNGDINQWVQISGLYSLVSSNRTIYIDSVSLNEMTEIVLENVTEIKPYAFYNCNNLTSVTIGNGVTSIGWGAFSGCSSLTNITVPDGVTSIDSQAFRDCSKLTSVTIPDSVTSIGGSAFYNCSSLTNIRFNGTKAQWQAISKGDYWKLNVPSACVVHCDDGDIAL